MRTCISDLGVVHAGLGRKEEAVQHARRGMELLPASKEAWFAPMLMAHAAETYARVGEVAPAVELLERILRMPRLYGSPSVQELRLEPRWDPLRRDARFQRLVREGGPD